MFQIEYHFFDYYSGKLLATAEHKAEAQQWLNKNSVYKIASPGRTYCVDTRVYKVYVRHIASGRPVREDYSL